MIMIVIVVVIAVINDGRGWSYQDHGSLNKQIFFIIVAHNQTVESSTPQPLVDRLFGWICWLDSCRVIISGHFQWAELKHSLEF